MASHRLPRSSASATTQVSMATKAETPADAPILLMFSFTFVATACKALAVAACLLIGQGAFWRSSAWPWEYSWYGAPGSVFLTGPLYELYEMPEWKPWNKCSSALIVMAANSR